MTHQPTSPDWGTTRPGHSRAPDTRPSSKEARPTIVYNYIIAIISYMYPYTMGIKQRLICFFVIYVSMMCVFFNRLALDLLLLTISRRRNLQFEAAQLYTARDIFAAQNCGMPRIVQHLKAVQQHQHQSTQDCHIFHHWIAEWARIIAPELAPEFETSKRSECRAIFLLISTLRFGRCVQGACVLDIEVSLKSWIVWERLTVGIPSILGHHVTMWWKHPLGIKPVLGDFRGWRACRRFIWNFFFFTGNGRKLWVNKESSQYWGSSKKWNWKFLFYPMGYPSNGNFCGKFLMPSRHNDDRQIGAGNGSSSRPKWRISRSWAVHIWLAP